ADRQIRQREDERNRKQQEITVAKVDLAKENERVHASRAKHLQIAADLEQRLQEQKQSREQLAGARDRLVESQLTMLRASAALADGYLEKERAEARLAELLQERERQRQKRQQLADQTQAAQNAWRAQQEQAHARELVVNDMTHHRDATVDRLRE